MPYSDLNDTSLPDNVKKMPEADRKVWVGAWNGSYESCMKKSGSTPKQCEAVAFPIAHAAVNKAKDKKDMMSDIQEAPLVDTTITTFEELDAFQAAQEQADNMTELADQTTCLVENIMNNPDVPDKPSALQKIVDGLKLRLSSLMGKAKKATVTKTENGTDFAASDYAVVPDPQMPSEWKLRLAESKSGDFTVAQVGRAITAMQPGGFRGQKVELTADEKKQAVSKISAAIGKLGADDTQKANLRDRLDAVKEKEISYFTLTKDKAGDYRWFALVSNHFRDADNPPEIFETKAHKDFVAALDAKECPFPELWLWHTPGTKCGQADWADFDNGFLMASGTFDKDKKDIADKLVLDPNLAVSHGYNFHYSNKEKGIIGWYRTFEISPLPKEAAANPWTGIEIIKQEANKDMDAKKRSFLVNLLGEDKVKALESRPAELSKSLKDAGIEYKEVETPDTKTAVPAEVPKPAEVAKPEPAPVLSTKEITEAAVKALTESEPFKTLVTLQAENKGKIEKLEAAAAEAVKTIKTLQKSDDEKIAEVIAPRSMAAGLKRASESKDNLVDPAKDKELAAKEAVPKWLEAALTPIK